MAAIDELARDFLAREVIAVAGVSHTREDAANHIYRTLRARGYRVYAVNPAGGTVLGDPCYPDLASLPEVPEGVVIVTSPAHTEQLVRACVDLGIRRVWMHDMLGTRPRLGRKAGARITSVSDEAVRLCRENGITVIPGSCPMQFLGDFGHTCIRGVLRLTGALAV